MRATSAAAPAAASMLAGRSFAANKCRPQNTYSGRYAARQQVAVTVVIGVEEPPLLLPMHRIVGRVQIEDDLARRTLVRVQEQVDHQPLDGNWIVTDLVISRRLVEAKRGAIPRRDVAAEHILLIGSNRLSLLYIKFIRAYSPGLHRIMAVLDDRPEMIGRAIDGVRFIGPPNHLEPVVNEFAEHGIRIGHVIVGGDPEMLSPATLPEIRRICDAHEIRLDFIPELIGLQRLQPP
jgi:hypothetical protein